MGEVIIGVGIVVLLLVMFAREEGAGRVGLYDQDKDQGEGGEWR